MRLLVHRGIFMTTLLYKISMILSIHSSLMFSSHFSFHKKGHHFILFSWGLVPFFNIWNALWAFQLETILKINWFIKFFSWLTTQFFISLSIIVFIWDFDIYQIFSSKIKWIISQTQVAIADICMMFPNISYNSE